MATATAYTAINAVMAHNLSRPADDAPIEHRANWLFEHSIRLSELSRRVAGDDVWMAERALILAEAAQDEASALLNDLVMARSPWEPAPAEAALVVGGTGSGKTHLALAGGVR
uniref:hypothetical protein n=1 Tax=Saccharothrix espanaensis TaxID=103731 RepID=UPI003F490DDA